MYVQVLIRWATQTAGLKRDVLDGETLCHLVEVLTKKRPEMPAEGGLGQENITLVKAAFQVLEEAGLPAASLTCSPDEIAKGDLGAIDSLLWSLAETFVILPRFSGIGSTNWRGTLMTWCQSLCSDRGVRVNDFHRSWQNGLAFCAIVDSAMSDSATIGMQTLSPNQAEANLHLSFTVAQRSLGVISLLDAAELATPQLPDERWIQWSRCCSIFRLLDCSCCAVCVHVERN
jgi:hypothetical protein